MKPEGNKANVIIIDELPEAESLEPTKEELLTEIGKKDQELAEKAQIIAKRERSISTLEIEKAVAHAEKARAERDVDREKERTVDIAREAVNLHEDRQRLTDLLDAKNREALLRLDAAVASHMNGDPGDAKVVCDIADEILAERLARLEAK